MRGVHEPTEWFAVTSQGNFVLAVYGAALLSAAQEMWLPYCTAVAS